MSGPAKVTSTDVALLNKTVKSFGNKSRLQNQIRQLNREQRDVVIRATNIAQKALAVDAKVLSAYELSYIEEATALLQIDRNRPITYCFLTSIGHIFSNIFGSRIASSTVISKIEAFKTAAKVVAEPTDTVDLRNIISTRKDDLKSKKESSEKSCKDKTVTYNSLGKEWEEIEKLIPQPNVLDDLSCYIDFQTSFAKFKNNVDVSPDKSLVLLKEPADEINKYFIEQKYDKLHSLKGLEDLKKKCDKVKMIMKIIISGSKGDTELGATKIDQRIASLERTLADINTFNDVSKSRQDRIKIVGDLTNAAAAVDAQNKVMPLIKTLKSAHDKNKSASEYLKEMTHFISASVSTIEQYATTFKVVPLEITEMQKDLKALSTKDAGNIKTAVGDIITKHTQKLDALTKKKVELSGHLSEIDNKLHGPSKSKSKNVVSTSPVLPSSSPVTKKQKLEALAAKFDKLTGSPASEILNEFGSLDKTDRDQIFGKFYPKLPSGYKVLTGYEGRDGESGFADYTNIPDNATRHAAILEYANTLS